MTGDAMVVAWASGTGYDRYLNQCRIRMTQRQVRAADFHLNRIPQRRPPNQAQPRPRHKPHLPKSKRIITLQVNAIDHTT